MNRIILASNADLFVYLTTLAEKLKEKNLQSAATLLEASRFALGSPSEFFNEAQVALKTILVKCSERLTEEQVTDIDDVIDQIDNAFKRSGGA